MLSTLLLTLALGTGASPLGLRPMPLLPPPPMAAFPAPAAPNIDARSWMVYSVDQGAELGSKDPDLPMAPASITKLMTAIIAVERLDLASSVTISAYAASIPIGYTGQPDVRTGEVWLAYDLLSNVMVQSGNDASTAIAEAAGGSEGAFVALMNERAAALGMTNTNFDNPHGLDNAEHLTTARDLIAMGRAALGSPPVMRSARIKAVTFRVAGRVIPVSSSNRDLGVFPGLLGLKTGDTANAGQTLLSYTKTQHDQLVAVVLGSPDRRANTRELVAWAMTAMGPRDHFFAVVAGTDLALSFPEWYQPRLAAAGHLSSGKPTLPERTPLTDDLHAAFRRLLPELLGGDP